MLRRDRSDDARCPSDRVRKSMAREPLGHALLTCDAVARDPNNKITLYGIFDRIWADSFPAIHPMLSVYWKCYVPGPGRVSVRIMKPDGSQLMDLEPAETAQEAHLSGTFTLSPIEFPIDGTYTLALRYNEKDIMTTNLRLQKQGQG
jgi:hypothetical protein